MSDYPSPLHDKLDWQIVFEGDMAVDAGQYSRHRKVVLSDSRMGTRDDAFEWTSEDLGFWSDFREVDAEESSVNWGYWLRVSNGSSCVAIRLIKPVPYPVDHIEQTQEPSDENLDVYCPGPCGQTDRFCTCNEIVAGTRLTPVRHRALAPTRFR